MKKLPNISQEKADRWMAIIAFLVFFGCLLYVAIDTLLN